MESKFRDNFKIIEECNIIDDAFFQKVMEDAGASEELLQIILGDRSIRVLECIPQYSLNRRMPNGTYGGVRGARN